VNQFIIHHLDHRLTWRQTAYHLLTNGFFLYPGNKGLDHRKRYIGFQQCHPYFTHRLLDIIFRQPALTA